MKHQKGFTIIELIVVIIILGILTAVAAPKFVNLTEEAANAAAAGTAGAVASASAINMVEKLLREDKGHDVRGTAKRVCDADVLNELLQNKVLGKEFLIEEGEGDCSENKGANSVTCKITKSGTAHDGAIATVMCAGKDLGTP